MSLVLKIVLASVIILTALVVALVRKRQSKSAPTQPTNALPSQLDREDFPHPDMPWCVVVFSSATCGTCADVVAKAKVLECPEVVVAEIEYSQNRQLHERYHIDAVPSLVIAGSDGVVHAGFKGPISATDLWAAVAECRKPGSSPEPDLGR